MVFMFWQGFTTSGSLVTAQMMSLLENPCTITRSWKLFAWNAAAVWAVRGCGNP